jgi:DNA-binding response OmpR family regulator
VTEAGDGAAALRAFDSQPSDALVLDVMMPLLNGVEVLRRIRGRSSVPVLLLTAREDDRQGCPTDVGRR